jgi:hypothetical protein
MCVLSCTRSDGINDISGLAYQYGREGGMGDAQAPDEKPNNNANMIIDVRFLMANMVKRRMDDIMMLRMSMLYTPRRSARKAGRSRPGMPPTFNIAS